VDVEKCVSCGTCSKVCKENAIFWVKGKTPIIFEDLCTGCGACWIVCPHDAINRRERVVGETFETRINDDLWLLTGISKPGISETGPIVREAKKRALNLAKRIGAEIMIVDTAPGTHCNVIQALLGCEKAYIVTEPTPLGAHDASLILDLLRMMNIETEIVLNKADIGSEAIIRKIADEYDVPITIRIPYSEDLIKAYSEGRLDRIVGLI